MTAACCWPLTGVWYHSSDSISCKHCLRKTTVDKKTKEEATTYCHTVLAGALVRPGKTEALPVMGEFIRNEDGKEKQDCERNAAKRWLSKHADEYKWLKPTLLGDDLFSNYPWLNGVDIRDSPKTLKVNYVYLEIENGRSGKVTYRNSWVTDKAVDADNVEHIVSCGRARERHGRRTEFFIHLRAALWFGLHEGWDSLLMFVALGEKPG